MAQQYRVAEEPDESIAVYDGMTRSPADIFATLEDAEAWVSYHKRDDAASPKVQERTRERIRQLIAQWSAEAAAEFNLELSDVRLDIRWAIEAVLDEMCPE
jgi:hypothetical protein